MYASTRVFQWPLEWVHTAQVYALVCALGMPVHAGAVSVCTALCLDPAGCSPHPQGLLSSLQFNLILSAVSLFLSSSPDVAIKQM